MPKSNDDQIPMKACKDCGKPFIVPAAQPATTFCQSCRRVKTGLLRDQCVRTLPADAAPKEKCWRDPVFAELDRLIDEWREPPRTAKAGG